jgi:hypothetical protein
MANKQSVCFIIAFHNFATLENWLTLSMPKFLAGCHYNEEGISWHFKKKIVHRPVQIDGSKFATGRILEKKPGRSCKGADSSRLSSKVS